MTSIQAVCPHCEQEAPFITSDRLTEQEAESVGLDDVQYFHVCTRCSSVLTDNGIEYKHTHGIQDSRVIDLAFSKFPQYADARTEVWIDIESNDSGFTYKRADLKSGSKSPENLFKRIWRKFKSFITF